MSSSGSNNGGRNNSGTPFWLALLAVLLGTGGVAGLITALRGTPPTPTPTPSLSTDFGGKVKTEPTTTPTSEVTETKSPERTPEITPSPFTSPVTPKETSNPVRKSCLGIRFNLYSLTLRSKQSSAGFYFAAVITEILNDYPIASSGLKPGDGIVAIENNPIYTSEQLSDAVNAQTNTVSANLVLSHHETNYLLDVGCHFYHVPTDFDQLL